MKKKINAFFRRFMSVLVVLALITSVFCVAAVAAASFDDILGIEDDEVCDLIRRGILNGYGITPEGLTMEYFTSYYDYVTNDWWGLATGSGGVYASDGTFNDTYLVACEQQVAMFFAGNGIPFDWSEFLEYAKARRASELAGSSFSDDDYTASNDLSPIHISGEMLKASAADYNSRYMPMAVSDSYVWSYQASTTSKRYARNTSDWLKSFQFEPYVPVYSNTSTTWGGKSWGGSKDEGVYILPFYYDDDNSHGAYYHKYYAHIYVIPATSDTVAQLCMDVYQLSDNSLYQSVSHDWNSDYSYYSFTLKSYFSIYAYKSSSDYYSNTGSWSCLISRSLTDFIASDYNNSTLNILINSSSFTPDTDKKDDWGYYVQNSPFELFANQSQIDFNKIPDNYVITVSGDTIYDYSITNPDTGDSTTINNYITNNYNFPDKKDDDSSGGGSGGSVSGDITVSGNVDVSGKIEIDTKPIDININVNSGSDSNPDISVPTLEGLDEGQQGINDLIDYYQDSANQIGGFFSSFLAVVPAPIRNMVPLTVGLIIFLGLVYALRR